MHLLTYVVAPIPLISPGTGVGGMAQANVLIVLPPGEDIVPAGETRQAIWLGSSRP